MHKIQKLDLPKPVPGLINQEVIFKSWAFPNPSYTYTKTGVFNFHAPIQFDEGFQYPD